MSDLEHVLDAAYVLISEHAPFEALAGADVGQDTDGSVPVPWLFQDADDAEAPYRDPKSSGKSAVVLGFTDTWGINRHNTAGLPLLQVLIFSDLTRNEDGTPQIKDGKARALRVFDAIDSLLHDPGNRLGGTRVDVGDGNFVRLISTARREGPAMQPVPNGDGMVRLMARYEWVVA